MSLYLISQQITALCHGLIPWYEWQDGPPKGGGNPPGPVFTALKDYMVASVLRDISKLPEVAEIAPGLYATARELAGKASQRFLADWEDEELCPRPRPFPWPYPKELDATLFETKPEPEPWFGQASTPAMTSMIVAQGLRQLAPLVSDEKISASIRSAGEELVRDASSKLYDEYRGTRITPDSVRAADVKVAV